MIPEDGRYPQRQRRGRRDKGKGAGAARSAITVALAVCGVLADDGVSWEILTLPTVAGIDGARGTSKGHGGHKQGLVGGGRSGDATEASIACS